MQTETHYTDQATGNGTVKVFRKADNVHIGTITKLHRGWEANHGAGVRLVFGTRIEAFTSLADADLAVGKQGYRAGQHK